jgi:hypothetical protein
VKITIEIVNCPMKNIEKWWIFPVRYANVYHWKSPFIVSFLPWKLEVYQRLILCSRWIVAPNFSAAACEMFLREVQGSAHVRRASGRLARAARKFEERLRGRGYPPVN